MVVPNWFARELQAFDPLLRLRWSNRREMYQLERKVMSGVHPGTTKGDDEDDDYVRGRDGYLLVASIPPRGLSRFVFERLRVSDLWAHGGWLEVAREIEAAEEVAEDERWRQIEMRNRDLAKDLFNLLAVRQGRTVFNAGWLA